MSVKVLASLFVESVDDNLTPIEGLPIQLAFYKRSTFRNFDHANLLKRLNDKNIHVESVHAPAADVFHNEGNEFLNTIETIKNIYDVKIITVHPQRGTKKHAKNYYRKIEEHIRNLDVIIAYETFEEIHDHRKWITQVNDMHKYFDLLKFDFLGVTYDFTHSDFDKNLNEIKQFNSRIHAIHLSDARKDRPLDPNEKHQHLPLGYGDYQVIEFLEILQKIEYSGLIIVEYLPQYNHLLKQDTILLAGYALGNKEPLLSEYHKRRKEVHQ